MRIFQNAGGSLGTMLTNRSEVRDGSRRRINYGNICHYSDRKFNTLPTIRNSEGVSKSFRTGRLKREL
jgi:hypothetical protein